MLDIARNKLRNNHATTTKKGMQQATLKNREDVARFFAAKEAFEERAAILEFDAGLSRSEAERQARALSK